MVGFPRFSCNNGQSTCKFFFHCSLCCLMRQTLSIFSQQWVWLNSLKLPCFLTDQLRTNSDACPCTFTVTCSFRRKHVHGICSHVIAEFLSISRPWTSALPLFPASPLFSRTNWKTSVIILILAQNWWDQRWPAGWGRGADGCMLRGTRQRPFRF